MKGAYLLLSSLVLLVLTPLWLLGVIAFINVPSLEGAVLLFVCSLVPLFPALYLMTYLTERARAVRTLDIANAQD